MYRDSLKTRLAAANVQAAGKFMEMSKEHRKRFINFGTAHEIIVRGGHRAQLLSSSL